jgi:single-strand DNA-binding protein
MRGINLFICVGNLVRDPEIKQSNGGLMISTFTLAINDKYKDKETVEYIRCVAFGKTAEIMSKYCKKGDAIYIQSKFKTDTYEKDGVKKHVYSFIVNNLAMLSRGKKHTTSTDEANANPTQDDYEAPDFDIDEDLSSGTADLPDGVVNVPF